MHLGEAKVRGETATGALTRGVGVVVVVVVGKALVRSSALWRPTNVKAFVVKTRNGYPDISQRAKQESVSGRT